MYLYDECSNGLIETGPLFELMFNYYKAGDRSILSTPIKGDNGIDASDFIILKTQKFGDTINIPIILIPFYNWKTWDLFNEDSNGLLFKIPIIKYKEYSFGTSKKSRLKTILNNVIKHYEFGKKLAIRLEPLKVYNQRTEESSCEFIIGDGIICDTAYNPLIISSVEWAYMNYPEQNYCFNYPLRLLYTNNLNNVKNDFKFVLRIKYDIINNPQYAELYRLLKKDILNILNTHYLFYTDDFKVKLSDVIKVEFVNSFNEFVKPIHTLPEDTPPLFLGDELFCKTLKKGLNRKIHELTTFFE